MLWFRVGVSFDEERFGNSLKCFIFKVFTSKKVGLHCLSYISTENQ